MDPKIRYKTLTYLSEDNNDKVLVTIEVKGLQKKNKNEAKNATIHKEFKERSMCVIIDGTKGKMENKHFKLNVQKLPGEINPSECTLKIVDDSFIEVALMKADKETWDLKNGLETFKEELIDEP